MGRDAVLPDSTTTTIVIVPRERFSCTLATLESVLRHTPGPYELICVDGGSPPYVQHYLEQAAAQHGFRLIRCDRYLGPNEARNLGVAQARGQYVAIIDNDTVVMPGWLDALTRCAEETGAGVVTPLVFIGEPEQRIIHAAGGELHLEGEAPHRQLRETHPFWNVPYGSARAALKREPCGYSEYHCLLARRDVLANIGGFDENILAVAEQSDFSLAVREHGYVIWFEPEAQVTHIGMRPFVLADLAYFKLRWSEDWTQRTLDHLIAKWRLDPQCEVVTASEHFAATHRLRLPIPAATLPRVATGTLPHTRDLSALCAQCAALGWPDENINALRSVDHYAQRWFGHLMRMPGAPLIDHLRGVASVLAAHGASTHVVLAGLLYPAYALGALDGQPPGITEAKRHWVARMINPSVEALLHVYASANWQVAERAMLPTEIDDLSLIAANAALILLAADIDDWRSRSDNAPNAGAVLRRRRAFYQVLLRALAMPDLLLELETIVGEKQ
jgi:GT2 family glycosyltransferase